MIAILRQSPPSGIPPPEVCPPAEQVHQRRWGRWIMVQIILQVHNCPPAQVQLYKLCPFFLCYLGQNKLIKLCCLVLTLYFLWRFYASQLFLCPAFCLTFNRIKSFVICKILEHTFFFTIDWLNIESFFFNILVFCSWQCSTSTIGCFPSRSTATLLSAPITI